MTFPTTPILDDFNRPDEGPPPSAEWTDSIIGAGVPGLMVVGNELNASAATDCESYWTIPTNSECEVYAQLGTNIENIYLYARVQNPGTAGVDGYMLDTRSSGNVALYRWDNAVGTFLTSITVPGGVGVGDWIGMRLLGSVITMWHRPAAGIWNMINVYVDGTYLDGGVIGISLESGPPSDTADNFGGGDYTLPSALALEQIDRDDVEEGTNTALVVNGHKFLNDGKTTFLEIENGATQFTLIVRLAQTVDGQAASNETYTILANKDYMLGPFPTEIYNQPDDDMMMMYVHYGDITDGTVTPWRLGR